MRNLLIQSLIGLLIIVTQVELFGQYQLLLVKGNRVIHRFKKGESVHTKWRGSKKEHWGFIVDVSEFNIVTSQDTVEVSRIDKVLLPGKPLINKIGKVFISVGVLYLAIDQFNWAVVQGHDPRMDDVVWKPAAILVGAGIPMIFFRKKWAKIKNGVRLVIVDRKSRLYIPDMD